jgi:uncharacterized protein YfkK (UPF0435 family)
MPKGIAKPKTYNRYGLNVLDPITKEVLRTEYFKNVDEIAEKLNMKNATVINLINKRSKKLSCAYDIFHIDKENNRIDDIWKWKDHKRNAEDLDAC